MPCVRTTDIFWGREKTKRLFASKPPCRFILDTNQRYTLGEMLCPHLGGEVNGDGGRRYGTWAHAISYTAVQILCNAQQVQ